MKTQLTIGELIKKLESVELHKDYGDKEVKNVYFDFGTAIPTTPDSWRGDYSQLALGYMMTGYDSNENHMSDCKLDSLISTLKKATQETFTGWKGGEYAVSKDTVLWVANPGNVGNTGIIDVLDDGYRVVLITKYFEY